MSAQILSILAGGIAAVNSVYFQLINRLFLQVFRVWFAAAWLEDHAGISGLQGMFIHPISIKLEKL